MPRIEPVQPEQADEKVAPLLDKARRTMGGRVINLVRQLAVSPAALEAYLGLKGGLRRGSLPAQLQESIALAVAEANECTY